MYKVILRGKKSYHTLEFVFPDMVTAGGFISTALRRSVEDELEAIVEEAIPEGFAELDDDINETLE